MATIKAVVLGSAHPHVVGMAGAVAKIEGAELLGIWDSDAQRRAANSEKLQCPQFEQLSQALESGANLALIGDVPSERASLSAQAVTAGMGVVVDKPLALTHEALDEVVAAVEKHNRPVMTYYPYRFSPLLLAAKHALDTGRIGQLVRVYSAGPHKLNPDTRPAWHFTRKDNGGCLIDIGAHHFDICCWMADAAPQWISAWHANFTQPQHKEFQDFAKAVMQFPSGAFAEVEVDWLNPASTRTFGDTRVWLQGTTGKIELRLGDEKRAEIWTADVAGEPLDLEPYQDQNYTHEMYKAVAAGDKMPVPQDEIWRAARVALQAFESAQQNGKAVS